MLSLELGGKGQIYFMISLSLIILLISDIISELTHTMTGRGQIVIAAYQRLNALSFLIKESLR